MFVLLYIKAEGIKLTKKGIQKATLINIESKEKYFNAIW